MEAIDCIKTRRSVRKFSEKQVSWDDLMNVIDCGRMAPSAGNLQSWKFIIVKDPDPKKQIANACVDQLWIAEASFIIVIVSETEKMKRFYDVRGERLYSVQSCAAAAENMLLGAHALGLGACWIGAFDEEKIRTILGCPAETRPQIIIPLGHPSEISPKPNKFPIEIVAYWRRWRGRVYDYDKAMDMWAPKTEAVIKGVVNIVKNAPEHIKKHSKKVVEHVKKKVKERKAKKKKK